MTVCLPLFFFFFRSCLLIRGFQLHSAVSPWLRVLFFLHLLQWCCLVGVGTEMHVVDFLFHFLRSASAATFILFIKGVMPHCSSDMVEASSLPEALREMFQGYLRRMGVGTLLTLTWPMQLIYQEGPVSIL